MNDKEKLEDLIYKLLDLMHYTDMMGIVKMRLNDLPDKKIKEIADEIAQTVKKW